MISARRSPLIADLLSIPTGDRYPALESHPAEAQGEDTRGAVAQVEGLAARQPVLMVFEESTGATPPRWSCWT